MLVKFLEHSNLLSQIVIKKNQDSSETEVVCFIPAILECAKPEDLTKSPPSDIDTPSPIKITFQNGYVPIGVFCAMISRLASEGPECILGVYWELVESGVKRNLSPFKSIIRDIVLLLSPIPTALRFESSDRIDPSASMTSALMCYMIKEVNSNIIPIIAFDCKCGRQQSLRHTHLCQLSSGMSTSFICNHRQVTLTAHQKHWFTEVNNIILYNLISSKVLVLSTLVGNHTW